MSVADAGGIQRPAYRVIAHPRQIFDTAPPDQHHRVLLEVVALTANIGGDLEPIRQADTGDLA